MTQVAQVGTRRARLPLNNLAVAFGSAGLARIWTVAADLLDAPESISVVLWAVVFVVWVALMIAHAVRGRQTTDTLADQLRHPAQGPIAALLPVVGMLIGAQLHRVAPRLGLAMVVFFLVVSAAFAGWLLAHWVGGNLRMENVHGGYFLPTVAGGFIAAGSLADVGLRYAAVARYAVEWLGLERPVFWQAWAWAIVLAISVFILAIAARTIKLLIPAEASRLP